MLLPFTFTSDKSAFRELHKAPNSAVIEFEDGSRYVLKHPTKRGDDNFILIDAQQKEYRVTDANVFCRVVWNPADAALYFLQDQPKGRPWLQPTVVAEDEVTRRNLLRSGSEK